MALMLPAAVRRPKKAMIEHAPAATARMLKREYLTGIV
jgi:hypothetical protein